MQALRPHLTSYIRNCKEGAINLCLNKYSRGLKPLIQRKYCTKARFGPGDGPLTFNFHSSLENSYVYLGLETTTLPLSHNSHQCTPCCCQSKAHLCSWKEKQGRLIIYIREQSGDYQKEWFGVLLIQSKVPLATLLAVHSWSVGITTSGYLSIGGCAWFIFW